jgi:acetyl-CoA carboxylase biotin carboxylase subunit
MRLHLGERDCSVQRRHQKLIEESPAPALPAETRAGLHKAALAAAAAVNYVSAGTVEFLVDARSGHFYFIEMNTRIQVEHPVTEMITGIDLIREQIRIAAGEPLGYRQDDVRTTGHALECRVNAEDPVTFAPSAGRVTAWLPPGGFGVRVDSHLMAPYAVPPFYDSLRAKIVVHGRDRAEAIGRMRQALRETILIGIQTNVPFHLRVLEEPDFAGGAVTTRYIELHPDLVVPAGSHDDDPFVAAACAAAAARGIAKRSLGSDGGAQSAIDNVAWRHSARWRR